MFSLYVTQSKLVKILNPSPLIHKYVEMCGINQIATLKLETSFIPWTVSRTPKTLFKTQVLIQIVTVISPWILVDLFV